MDVNPESILLVKRRLAMLLKIADAYQYLTDSYVIEFFVQNHWEKLPLQWREVLDKMHPSAFVKEIFEPSSNTVKTVFPLSLIAFKVCCFQLPLSRRYDVVQDDGEFNQKGASQSSLIKHIFRKHVNPKKQHEIRKLSKVISALIVDTKCSKVVDIGSGQGHLSRLLALGHGIDVTSIESDAKNVDRAKRFDVECHNQILKENPVSKHALPCHILHHIDPFISEKAFVKLLPFQPNLNSETCEHVLLTGLHACGDLSSTMINSFVESKCVTALVSVACCYMKLNHTTETNSLRSVKCGYPLSLFVCQLKNHDLSYKSREISCHANEVFAQRLLRNSDHLKIHCYRAALEKILNKKCPNLIRPGVQTIKKAYLLSFQDYIRLAFAKLNLTDPTPDEVDNNDITAMISDWEKVVIYYALCLMLGPIIESIILLDRAVYLYENGLNSSIKCIFNPELSPRCFALISTKGSTNV